MNRHTDRRTDNITASRDLEDDTHKKIDSSVSLFRLKGGKKKWDIRMDRHTDRLNEKRIASRDSDDDIHERTDSSFSPFRLYSQRIETGHPDGQTHRQTH
ncbi:hypothetical protein CRE_24228 [Caenorhabditis remanei]|uniref:Uncharacterized protein n=1 Tax=Caenorhabditis remanei TaxID=31234 RepID=E3NCX1_CAERE|nr:hypothetical protein CRE_24228 [Caenorhabditis remanei]